MAFPIEKEYKLDKHETIKNGPLTIYQLLPRSESPEMSIALIRLSGINQRVKNLESTARYYIILGEACFLTWNGEGYKLHEVKAGNFIEIPSGIPYQDIGRDVLMISINHPAFDPGKVEVLD